MALNADHKTLNTTALQRHNTLRALHKSPKLEIDWKLAKSAQAYADNLAKTNTFSHSESKGEYGENLASAFNSRAGFVFSGEAATQNWYDEIKDYKFDQEAQQTGKIGHFSQVVWKDTKYAGFGRAKNASGMFIVVGQYKPPGNFIGKFKENINSPSGPAPPLPKDEPKASSSHENAPAKGKQTPAGQSKSKEGPKPEIGPKSKDDKLIKSSTKTSTVDGKKVIELTETYKTPDGKTYDRIKKTETKG